MITGQVTTVGTLTVNGETLTGVFVEAGKEQIGRAKGMLYRDVTVSHAGLMPTLAEVQAHVQSKLWEGHNHGTSIATVEMAYIFIKERLGA